MNQEEKEVIIPLCKKYKNIFYNGNNDLSFTSAVKHHIKTDDDEPIYTKSYKYPYHLKEEIQTEIKKLLNNKIIRPSISPYSSPVCIVPKKIDYRKLNDKTVEEKYPLPRIDEIWENLVLIFQR